MKKIKPKISNPLAKAEKPLTKSTNTFPVVGIGASAGGLDAFKKLLKAIPENSGMAYVLVQHLDPNHESLLPEILQKVTTIPVLEIADDIKVQPNHIYVIPSNKMMVATDGVLLLSPRTTKKNERNLPVDLFFASLAEVHQSHSIGVVLSGTASDGTQGLKAIKDHGGITIAQSEESAEYDGMPHSAIQAGVVDFILPPEEIPQKLLEVTKIINGNGREVENLPQQEADVFKQILALLRIRKGTDFTYYKQTTIRRRIFRRMALNKNEEPTSYLKFLRENKEEQDVLYQDLLIPVTSFFRDPKSFDNLCNTVFPTIVKNKTAGDPIRVWVAGCSTGQEVYSVAICLKEYLGYNGSSGEGRVQIFATDISEPAIAKARTGIYTKGELDGITPVRLLEFFTKTNGSYQVNKYIRDICVFAVHNFLKDPPFGKLDLICCRNVLIYMETYLQKKALTTFHYALNNNGFLLLGKSETISSVPELFGIAHKGDKLFLRKDVPGKYMHTATLRSEQGFADLNVNAKSENIRTDFQKTADDIMLSKYTPAGVVVNEAMDIVHFRGKTVNYLEQLPGKPSHNLLKMAKEGLAFELRNILHKAKKEKASVTKENVPIQINGTLQTITIEAMPLPDTIEPHFLILFHERSPDSYRDGTKQLKVGSKKTSSAKTKNDDKDLRIAQLEKELAAAREDMRSITEDQEAANEELQSANEELLSGSEEMQSLNEELETGKEELQSTNEELGVVNQEMISLNEQVTGARDYAEAIITTIREPLLVLDKNLRVKSANNSFYKAFQAIESETEGRLVYDLGNRQWNIPELRVALEEILPQKTKLTDFEVRIMLPNAGSRIMLLNGREIIAEKTEEKLILLAIEDITQRKQAARKIETSEKRYREMISSSTSLICILEGEDLIISIANDAILKLWGKGNEIIGKPFLKVFPEMVEQGIDDILHKVFETGETFTAYEMPVETIRNGEKQLGYYTFSYQPQKNLEGVTTGIISIAQEVTPQAELNLKIKESEERFRILADESPIFVFIIEPNAEATISYWNKTWLNYTGQTFEEALGRTWYGVIHPDDVPGIMDIYVPAFEKRQPYLLPGIRVRRRDGAYRWHMVKSNPRYLPNGEFIGFVGVGVDIHEQRLAEEEVRRFKYMADNASDPFILMRHDGTFAYINKLALETWGYTEEEAKHLRVSDVDPIYNDEVFNVVFAKALTEEVPLFETLHKKKDGSTYPVEVNMGGLILDGKPHLFAVARDITGRKKAQQALKDSEIFNSTVLENSPDCINIIDTKGQIQFMNSNGMSIMEIDNFSAFKNKPWTELWGKDNSDLVLDAINKALHGKTAQFQAFCPTAKGTPKWWDVMVSPVHEAGSDIVTNIISVSRDVTEQRAAQTLLEYRKALLEAHNESSADGILLVDAKGKIISYNHRFIEIWNMPQNILDAKDDEAALAHAMTQLVHSEEFIEKVKYLYEHPLETSTDTLEFKDGKIVARHGYPVVADDGSYYAWSWTFRDITEIRKAELVLQKSEENFRQLAELMPEKVSTADAAGNITYLNQNWLDYTGLGFEELINWGWEKMLHPGDLEENKKLWMQAISTGNDFEIEVRLKNKNGEYRWHLSRLSSVKNDNGKIIKWIAATTEIHGQKEQREKLEKAVAERTHELQQANETLGEKNEELIGLNKELEAFAYVSSHDLQEPLRKIQTFGSYIADREKQNLSISGRNYFDRMQEAAKRMRTLIDDLLAYSRTNSRERKFETIKLNDIIDEVKIDLKETIQEKNATIVAGEMCEASIIPFQFHQLFINLFGNSMKFSIPGRPAHITIQSKSGAGAELNNENPELNPGRLSPQKLYCHISIADKGIGFDPEYKDRIFNVFQRLHGKDEYPGTGIGLAIVKKIIDNHNGIITASGEINKGARFDIYIPA